MTRKVIHPLAPKTEDNKNTKAAKSHEIRDLGQGHGTGKEGQGHEIEIDIVNQSIKVEIEKGVVNAMSWTKSKYICS